MPATARTLQSTAHDATQAPWVVLVVDDDHEVRRVTRLVLSGVSFEGRGLDLIEASSASEALDLLRQRSDIAVMLLDVVMESPRAGLDLVRRVREDLDNHFVRIVLRTGQPDEAPEREVVATYDINDYREKTELTSTQLVATLYSALRSWRDILTVETQRQGLEAVIGASARIFEEHDQDHFVAVVFSQLHELLGKDADILCCEPSGGDAFKVRRPARADDPSANTERGTPLPPAVDAVVRQGLADGRSHFDSDCCMVSLGSGGISGQLLFVCLGRPFSDLDQQLLRLFGANSAIAWENLRLGSELVDSQLEMVYLLASTAETRSRETASHVQRVGLLAEMLGQWLGLEQEYCNLLRLAAPLHDIGKVAIPDAILSKPGPHSEQEQRIMRTHAEIGARLLGSSQRPVMRLAAEIAGNHHENFDGSGYPRGLAGEDIPLGGRITMVADVFDALGSQRCYKDPWPQQAIRPYLEQRRGSKFDPAILDHLLAHWDEALAIRERLPD